MKTRRGNVSESIGIITFLFILGITSIVGVFFMNALNTAIQDDTTIGSDQKNMMATAAAAYPGVIQFWFILFFVGLPLISAALAYFNYVHPVFFWISLLLVFFAVLVGSGLSELWASLADDADFGSVQAQMPIMNYVLSNYGLYSFFIFVVISAGTFVKLRGRGDVVGGF